MRKYLLMFVLVMLGNMSVAHAVAARSSCLAEVAAEYDGDSLEDCKKVKLRGCSQTELEPVYFKCINGSTTEHVCHANCEVCADGYERTLGYATAPKTGQQYTYHYCEKCSLYLSQPINGKNCTIPGPGECEDDAIVCGYTSEAMTSCQCYCTVPTNKCTAYEKKYLYTENCKTKVSTGVCADEKKDCAAGEYYDGSTGCLACPAPGTSVAGATSINDCCPSGLADDTVNDGSGTYHFLPEAATDPSCCWEVPHQQTI